ncbi:hypothetical protein QBC42DRAFT_296169 [Cladorrhinum samala]|uniref:Cell surface protein n=1 Tax=Cladorrhinum samala TaxID=585594 RepID=A0AAV9HUS1_9PEZI|nr:hypothetical protein QBC42DRAFT_296169 [Cladorrhinum samala]
MHPTTTFLACLATFLPLISAHGTLTEIRGANGVNMNGLSIPANSRNKNSIANTAIIRDSEIKSGRASPLGRTSGGGAVTAASALQAFSRAAGAGAGNAATLPTAADDGTVTVIYHQVNGDGAGPLDAAIDGTSGGTQANAFKTAQILQNVPGNNGRSSASNKDFTVKVKMPAGMTCDGTVGGVQNVCIVRVRNPAGPFGGAAAFTQSAKSRKRAEEFRKARRSEVAFTA